jgi:hypothetical protein
MRETKHHDSEAQRRGKERASRKSIGFALTGPGWPSPDWLLSQLDETLRPVKVKIDNR